MKILLISPANEEFINHSKSKKTTCTALPLLAAYTPKEHEIIMADQNYGDNVYMDNVDLVGISAMTPQANVGYKIASYYRERGVKVVMGGIHASFLQDEALKHVDSVCVGEGDALWKDILSDAENNRLKKIYKANELFPMENIPAARHDLLNRKRTTFSHTVIQASRGCPYNCEFCITSTIFGKRYRFRPVENVIEEIKQTGNKLIVFMDDNIFGNLEYSKKLFEALLPLKIKWAGQASLNMLTKDSSLLKLARKSGCLGLFVGIESVNNLTGYGISNKLGSASIHDVSRDIKKVLDVGIMLQSSMIFGLDNDDVFTFEKTVDFLKVNNVSFSSFCILTPYPGTKIHERFKADGRLIHENWSLYNNQNVTFYPKNMSPEQLKNGSDWAGNAFYKKRSILKRFGSNWKNHIYYLGMNVFTRTSNLNNHGPGSITHMSDLDKKSWLKTCNQNSF